MAKKLLCFDFDGTLTNQSTWEVLNARLGINPKDDQRLFTQYKEGNLDYKEWITELIRLYKEHPLVTKEAIATIAEGIMPRPDAQHAIDTAIANGYEVIAIAGALDVMVAPLLRKLGIDKWFSANTAVFNENDELIDIKDSGHERDAKVFFLTDYCQKNYYELTDVIAVGDGGNDLEIFRTVKGVLLGHNKELQPIAWKQIENLSELEGLL